MMFRQSIGSKTRNRAFIKIILLVVLCAAVSRHAGADVNLPDIPAGHTLRAFLDAFNSGDHDRIAACSDLQRML
jgi:hypothetical protein